MTPAERQAADELRRLMEAATPGPWIYEDGGYYVSTISSAYGLLFEVVGDSATAETNAAFIAAARNHLPAILDALEEVERERDEARCNVERFRNSMYAVEGHRNEQAARADALAARVAELEEGLRSTIKEFKASRVFVTTREKRKHPEGTNFFDEVVTKASALLADTKGGGDGA